MDRVPREEALRRAREEHKLWIRNCLTWDECDQAEARYARSVCFKAVKVLEKSDRESFSTEEIEDLLCY